MNYINAHATSTLAGDLAEANAIKKVFKNTSELKVNATKVNCSNIALACVFTSYMFCFVLCPLILQLGRFLTNCRFV